MPPPKVVVQVLHRLIVVRVLNKNHGLCVAQRRVQCWVCWCVHYLVNFRVVQHIEGVAGQACAVLGVLVCALFGELQGRTTHWRSGWAGARNTGCAGVCIIWWTPGLDKTMLPDYLSDTAGVSWLDVGHTVITIHVGHTVITMHVGHTVITIHVGHTVITIHVGHTVITIHVGHSHYDTCGSHSN